MSRRSFSVGVRLSLIFIGTAAFAQQPDANAVLLEAPSARSSYLGMYDPDPVAAAFSLTASCNVSTIEIVLRTPTTTTVTTFAFSLQNSLTDPITTFASASLKVPLGDTSAAVMNVNKTLEAGTYYLVGVVPGYFGTSATPGDVDGWLLSNGLYYKAAGAITDGYWSFNGSRWGLSGTAGHALAFTVHGSLVAPVKNRRWWQFWRHRT